MALKEGDQVKIERLLEEACAVAVQISMPLRKTINRKTNILESLNLIDQPSRVVSASTLTALVFCQHFQLEMQ